MPPHTDTTTVPARVLLAAVAQIDMALREAQGPVDNLGRALERLADELRTIDDADAGAAARQAALRALRVDLGEAIRSLQFYDRMFQHLSHVHDFLADATDDFDLAGPSPHPAHRWEQLRERLFRRLLNEEQRDVLHALMPPAHWVRGAGAPERDRRTVADDIELF